MGDFSPTCPCSVHGSHVSEDLVDVDRREARHLSEDGLEDLLVAAEQPGVRHHLRVERLVDVAEHLAVDVRRVGV